MPLLPSLVGISTGLSIANAALGNTRRVRSAKAEREAQEEMRRDSVQTSVDSSFRNRVKQVQTNSPVYWMNMDEGDITNLYDSHARSLPIDARDAPHIGYRPNHFNFNRGNQNAKEI